MRPDTKAIIICLAPGSEQYEHKRCVRVRGQSSLLLIIEMYMDLAVMLYSFPQGSLHQS